MSHYISASHGDNDITDVQIGAFNGAKADMFYSVLEAYQFYGGASGLGGGKNYSKDDIDYYLKQMDLIDEEILQERILSVNMKVEEERMNMLRFVTKKYQLADVQQSTDFEENKNWLKRFLQEIESYMEENDVDEIEISFN